MPEQRLSADWRIVLACLRLLSLAFFACGAAFYWVGDWLHAKRMSLDYDLRIDG